ncbi:excisionase family protein [Enterobacter sp. R1(2018)]|uniref:excisionase family protein n=1 Tax=Enterobacter sp. R1(2018) TaxID=2447891 RepID=UPI0038F8150B
MTARTSLDNRQIKKYRQSCWVEGVRFKRVSPKGKKTQRDITWYNLAKINQFIQDASFMAALPTGVEIKNERICTWFIYRRKRCREV